MIKFDENNPVRQDMCYDPSPGDNYLWKVHNISVIIDGNMRLLPKYLFTIPEVDTSSMPEYSIVTLQLDKEYYDGMPGFFKKTVTDWFEKKATATFSVIWGEDEDENGIFDGVCNSGIQLVIPPNIGN